MTNGDPQTTPETKGRPKVEMIDFTKPFYLTVRQAPTRNVVDVFQGKNASEKALASAAEHAVSNKVTVAVLGPQQAVYDAPAPIIAKQVVLDWNLVGGD